MATLVETQRLLWTLITAPEGVAKALDDDTRLGGDRRVLLARTVQDDGRLTPEERVDIYANMYFYRILDVLRADYPALLAAVGDVTFHNLITDYLLRHFPTHYSLRYAGARLPSFLATHSLNSSSPYLAELATFEWALVDAFDAADEPSLARADFLSIAPNRWPQLCFKLHPAVQLCEVRWAVHEMRRRVDAGEPPGTPRAEHTWVCIWRQVHRVRFRVLSPSEWQALATFAAGGTFAAACAASVDDCDQDDAAAAHLASALAAWVDEGLLSAVTLL